MTHKLIHTPNYLLVVDDSEIKEGGFVLVSCSELDIIETRKVKDYYNEQFLFDGGGQIHMDYCKKIIAHLPLNDSPKLEGVDLLDNNIFINYLKEFGYWNSFCIFIEKLYNEKRNI